MAGDRLVPSPGQRDTLPYLSNDCGDVVEYEKDPEYDDGDVEGASWVPREYAPVQAQDRELGYTDGNAVVDPGYIQPLPVVQV